MKGLVTVGLMALGLLSAPHAAADPSGWCEWTPELDVTACGLVVGVPPTGTLISEPGDWSQPETRTK
ncbi:hypothetical protein P5V34_04385 [Mycobacteroides abscessus subsp. abscessus]|uniref:hypothetical protein n=1 Tax=Mycobacteroides abscessus TaxID=36809 RepID=UPI00266B7D06|nr:hypothetical protein [Mycobacteroides abscessus]MDO3013224.1 hypothetical protein [Mycobacteroides abscessus subsp. abscessus]